MADRWYVTDRGALLYGDDTGGTTVFGLTAWKDSPERTEAIVALAEWCEEQVRRSVAVPSEMIDTDDPPFAMMAGGELVALIDGPPPKAIEVDPATIAPPPVPSDAEIRIGKLEAALARSNRAAKRRGEERDRLRVENADLRIAAQGLRDAIAAGPWYVRDYLGEQTDDVTAALAARSAPKPQGTDEPKPYRPPSGPTWTVGGVIAAQQLTSARASAVGAPDEPTDDDRWRTAQKPEFEGWWWHPEHGYRRKLPAEVERLRAAPPAPTREQLIEAIAGAFVMREGLFDGIPAAADAVMKLRAGEGP